MDSDVKPGVQTSEFWLVCGVSVTAFITALASGERTAIISSGAVAAFGVVGYLWTRYLHKSEAAAQIHDMRMEVLDAKHEAGMRDALPEAAPAGRAAGFSATTAEPRS